jgi:hypothetical protein
MKRIYVFLIAILQSIVFVINARAISITDVDFFIIADDFSACCTILNVYDPEAELMNAKALTCDYYPNVGVHSDSLLISMQIGTDNDAMRVYLYWNKTYFYKIELEQMAEMSAARKKSFIDKMIADFKKGEISFVERKFGKKLNEMNTNELCCASLTIQYWKMDVDYERNKVNPRPSHK